MSLYLYLVFVSHGGEDEYEQLNRQQHLDPNNADEEEVIGFNHKSLEIIHTGRHRGEHRPLRKGIPM